jgi:hypothetical protein
MQSPSNSFGTRSRSQHIYGTASRQLVLHYKRPFWPVISSSLHAIYFFDTSIRSTIRDTPPGHSSLVLPCSAFATLLVVTGFLRFGIQRGHSIGSADHLRSGQPTSLHLTGDHVHEIIIRQPRNSGGGVATPASSTSEYWSIPAIRSRNARIAVRRAR